MDFVALNEATSGNEQKVTLDKPTSTKSEYSSRPTPHSATDGVVEPTN